MLVYAAQDEKVLGFNLICLAGKGNAYCLVLGNLGKQVQHKFSFMMMKMLLVNRSIRQALIKGVERDV